MSTQTINLGLIGAGRIGRIHAENLSRMPGARLLAVADIAEEAAQRVAAELDIPHVYTDPRHLFDDSAIDAVVICSSTDTHATFIQQAADAGKHIFCEKPIHLDLAEIDRALAAVDAAGVKLQIGFNRRFDPSFRRAHELVASGAIGDPHILRITSRDPAPPSIDYLQVSGGIFLDMTIHDFDMARFLIGDEVAEVYAAGGVLVDPAIGQAGDIDTAVITLTFCNGVIGAIDNSRRAVYGYDQRVEVFGSEGMVVVGNVKPDTTILANQSGVHSSKPLYFFLERYAEAYRYEMIAFLEAIREDNTPPVTGRDGRMAVVMGHAAWASYRKHQPVPIPSC